jgi:geranylgeranyl diphosphate synthase, type II
VNCKNFVRNRQKRLYSKLESCLPKAQQIPLNLHKAMRYAVLNGGKRLRPLLVYATGKCFGVNINVLDNIAVAIEFIHVFSLIHDDLPAMDNDDLRRGVPSCHKAFGEATAILAGDALGILAFQVLTECRTLDAKIVIKLIKVLAQASGSLGMAGGQDIDMQTQKAKLSVAKIEQMYMLKTGGLINAAVKMAALVAPNVSSKDLVQLDKFANYFGLAFQVQDDIYDVGETYAQSDDNKVTYANLFGCEKSLQRVHMLQQRAEQALNQITQDVQLLKDLFAYTITI